MSNVVFIGLGNMGGPMANNLLKHGCAVCGYDLLPSAVKKHVDAGGTTTDSLEKAVIGADVIISMLPAGKHVETLYLGENGLLKQLSSGQLVIDCSTIEPETAKKVAQQADVKKIAFVDAPVSGGTVGAINATLTFMVGGSVDAVAKATHWLNIMGATILHAGETGAGQLAKVCNNMLLAVLMTGTSEALKLGIDNGLDPSVLSTIMQQSSGSNWVLDKYNPVPGVMENVPASHDYQGGFMVELMAKDLGLAMSTAAKSQTTVPMGALAESLYRLHKQKSGGQRDFSSIYMLYS
ncbi:MAG: 3-hydroxyisobutyrate dehydrogenase [Endozoicomonas sp. (ex Botrylloides leachii)]|nr:3-hydroxyisobutyrate dehydrogenase [Endozoicomonas sp. (ex Botrylloides leachii)]